MKPSNNSKPPKPHSSTPQLDAGPFPAAEPFPVVAIVATGERAEELRAWSAQLAPMLPSLRAAAAKKADAWNTSEALEADLEHCKSAGASFGDQLRAPDIAAKLRSIQPMLAEIGEAERVERLKLLNAIENLDETLRQVLSPPVIEAALAFATNGLAPWFANADKRLAVARDSDLVGLARTIVPRQNFITEREAEELAGMAEAKLARAASILSGSHRVQIQPDGPREMGRPGEAAA